MNLKPSFSLFSIKGVLTRKQFIIWVLYFFLIYLIAFLLLYLVRYGLEVIFNTWNQDLWALLITALYLMYFIVVLIVSVFASICLGVRRFHDLDRSWKRVILIFVPIIWILLFFYLIFTPSKDNSRFREDEKKEDEKPIGSIKWGTMDSDWASKNVKIKNWNWDDDNWWYVSEKYVKKDWGEGDKSEKSEEGEIMDSKLDETDVKIGYEWIEKDEGDKVDNEKKAWENINQNESTDEIEKNDWEAKDINKNEEENSYDSKIGLKGYGIKKETKEEEKNDENNVKEGKKGGVNESENMNNKEEVKGILGENIGKLDEEIWNEKEKNKLVENLEKDKELDNLGDWEVKNLDVKEGDDNVVENKKDRTDLKESDKKNILKGKWNKKAKKSSVKKEIDDKKDEKVKGNDDEKIKNNEKKTDNVDNKIKGSSSKKWKKVEKKEEVKEEVNDLIKIEEEDINSNERNENEWDNERKDVKKNIGKEENVRGKGFDVSKKLKLK